MVFDKLKFWKKHEDDFMPQSEDPLQNDPMFSQQEQFEREPSFNQNTPQYPGHAPFPGSPQQQYEEHNDLGTVRDVELILAKLETINSRLETIQHRLDKFEQARDNRRYW